MIHGTAAVAGDELEKSYRDLRVLRRVNLSVKQGSIFALLGPNGAGKTTTIKILSTLIKPDSGSAEICGFDVLRQPDRVRELISLTGQYAAVDEILTGRENMLLIGRLRRIAGLSARVDELLHRFGLLDAADRRVAAYSGGMRRRLDLAMSLLGDPSVIFLDEPTAGLDPQGRTAVWKIIKGLAQAGTTVFLTTQYLEEADQLADRIAILDKGEIVAEGSAAELKKLLPSGHIELRFLDEVTMDAARDALAGYGPVADSENLTVTCVTDGSLGQMTGLLKRLEESGITAAGFAQQVPTLEDVFLALVGQAHAHEEETK